MLLETKQSGLKIGRDYFYPAITAHCESFSVKYSHGHDFALF